MSEEALRARVAELESTVNTYETERKASEDRASAAIKEAHAKAAADLEAANAKLASTTERLSSFEQREAAKAEAIYKELPKEAQKKINKLKDKLDAGEWLELVQAEKAGAAPASKDEDPDAQPPPALGSGRGKNEGAAKKSTYKPEYADVIEEALGKEVEHVQLAQVEEDKHGNKSFRLPMKTFRKRINQQKGAALTKENAANRK